MGIINLTPDSFFEGNSLLYNKSKDKKIEKFKYADIIDIGAESSRPGSLDISTNEEILRLSSLKNIKIKGKILSIDSYKPKIIEYALNNGFNMINDISGGGKDFSNIRIAKKYNVPIVLMHMQGIPENMQVKPYYKNIIDELNSFFKKRIDYCLKIGVNIDDIIIDPGIGFGKTLQHNKQILLNLNEFKHFGCKILLGISRKSFLCINNDSPDDRLSQSLAIGTLCINEGVDILRVHDIEETYKMIMILNRMYE